MTTTAPTISLTQKDAARALGVSAKTLQNWARDGRLTPCRQEFLLRHQGQR